MTRLLTEGDLSRILDFDLAIGAVEAALRERGLGTAIALPRTGMKTAGGQLVFTPGGFAGMRAMGLRVYTAGLPEDEQLVAVWDALSGQLVTVILGRLLGAVRTGAIGGVAVKLLARPDAHIIGVIGAGQQARTQLMAAVKVRQINEVRIYRRTSELRERLARLWSEELGVSVRAVADSHEAVAGADIVITATPSPEPVISADWLALGVHVNSLGPKYRGRSEIGIDLIERADLLVSDFPEQYRREEPFILQGTRHLERLEDLATLLVKGVNRARDAMTVFLSHGLAGTEVAVALAFARRAEELGVGLEMRPTLS